jgi:hypothetical protein
LGLRGLHSNAALRARLRAQYGGWQRPVELVTPSGAMSQTARNRLYRQRQRDGRLVISVELDGDDIEMLCAAQLLDARADFFDRATIATALRRYLSMSRHA